MHSHALLGHPSPATEPLVRWTLHMHLQLQEGFALSASGVDQQHVLPHTCLLLQEQQCQRRFQQPSNAYRMAVTYAAWPCHVSAQNSSSRTPSRRQLKRPVVPTCVQLLPVLEPTQCQCKVSGQAAASHVSRICIAATTPPRRAPVVHAYNASLLPPQSCPEAPTAAACAA
jgi:hypothetical protein